MNKLAFISTGTECNKTQVLRLTAVSDTASLIGECNASRQHWWNEIGREKP